MRGGTTGGGGGRINGQVAKEDLTLLNSPSRRRLGLGPLRVLFLLTALAAMLRFYRLDWPALWLDEAATYARASGSFSDLMTTLSDQGFLPVHYLLYWSMNQVVLLTPGMMRLVPALAGVCMVPAIYLFGRGLHLNQRTCLFAAAIVASSAWGFTYSRDAKMYGHTWLFITLSWAGYLAFVRGSSDRSWIRSIGGFAGWLVASVLAVGLHATAAIPLLVQVVCIPVFLRDRWLSRVAALVFGLCVIAAGPLWYYVVYNSYLSRTGFVALPQTTLSTGSATAPSGSAAVEPDRDAATVAPDWDHSGIQWVALYNQNISAAELVLNTLTSQILGVQWPRERTDPGSYVTPVPDWFRVGITVAASLLVAAMVAGAMPWRRAGGLISGGSGVGVNPGDNWRTWLCLGIWIVVPAYGVFYCRSFPDFASPLDGLKATAMFFGPAWGAIALAVPVIAFVFSEESARGFRVTSLWMVAVAVAATVGVAAVGGGLNWYWSWSELVARPWLGPPVTAVTIALMWHYAGESFRERRATTLRLLGCVLVIFVLCMAMHSFWQIERQWSAHGGTVADAAGGGEGRPNKSVWMPRYLGYAWPALVMGIALLLSRLPGRMTGVSAVGVLCVVNLGQSVARLTVATEPPNDRIAVDLWTAHHAGVARRVFFNVRDTPGHHGLWYQGIDTHYYLYLLAPPALTRSPGHLIEHVYEGRVRSTFQLAIDLSPEQIAAAADPRTHTVILWRRLTPADGAPASGGGSGAPAEAPPESLGRALGNAWKVVSNDTHTQYQFWTWRRGDTWVRTEYHRDVEPGVSTTAGRVPSSAP